MQYKEWASSVLLGVACCFGPSVAGAQFSDAYVPQVDRSAGGGVQSSFSIGENSIYIHQMPEDARPRPVRSQNRRTQPRPPAPPTAALPVVSASLPSVGAGVTAALTPRPSDSNFPSVGRGVGGR